MDQEISAARIRPILNSQGGLSVEAEIEVPTGRGRGSAPRAIIAGRREQTLSREINITSETRDPSVSMMLDHLPGIKFHSQEEFDAQFSPNGRYSKVGSDISLAMSLAYCQAQAQAKGGILYNRLRELSEGAAAMPFPMINLFSGGVHGGPIPFQQLMLIPKFPSLRHNLEAAISIYNSIEAAMRERDQLVGYSASSGMICTIDSIVTLCELASEEIERRGLSKYVALGTDVAAEHLETGDGNYRLKKGEATINAGDLLALHSKLIHEFNFFYYEDPFGSADVAHWRRLNSGVKADTIVVGDDIFATNTEYLDATIASGILLKMNQIGTISGTLRAARKAESMGMKLCVSHRSKETEDTCICDLAVALGAITIKIGGPRRGDRVAKYNQLLRLLEHGSFN